MTNTGNIRRHKRVACDTKGRATWVDRSGQNKWAIVRIFDLSESGVRLEMPEPVETRSLISFISDAMRLRGQATVRFCRHQRGKYVVGAEFVGGTSWEPGPPGSQ